LKGLSCLKGNFHEQFLGGLAGAIPPGYPAGDSDIISLPNQVAGAARGHQPDLADAPRARADRTGANLSAAHLHEAMLL